jgi:hypothetical protein
MIDKLVFGNGGVFGGTFKKRVNPFGFEVEE